MMAAPGLQKSLESREPGWHGSLRPSRGPKGNDGAMFAWEGLQIAEAQGSRGLMLACGSLPTFAAHKRGSDFS